ncbi:MAG: translation initiation factor IF-2 N-terminal domain-containing protein, partial [Aestuariivirgaceae bacterium]|nr:translation initiation factor IF-2 N-terminal domain-containing protein [Aestuariivirgaceae bacterium]
MVLRTLTDEEKDARSRALAGARLREADERHKAIEDAKRRAEEEVLAEIERKAAAIRKADEDARRRTDEETKRKSEETARRLEPRPAGSPSRVQTEDDSRSRTRTFSDKPKRPSVPVPAAPQKVKTEADRRRGRLTVSNALNDDGDKNRSLAAFRRRTERQKKQAQGFQMPQEKIAREVMIPDAITIQELANRMAERAVDVIKMLMRQGQMFKINDIIDSDTAQLIAEEMGHKVKRVSEAEVEERLSAARSEDSDAVT